MRGVVFIACLLMGAMFGSARAQTPPAESPAALTRVYACAGIGDDAQRLACFDAAIGALRAAEQQGDFAAVDRQAVQELERDSFGFPIPSLTRLLPRFGDGDEEAAAPRLDTRVVRVIERAYGYHAFELENGQRWVQVEPRNVANVRRGDGAVSIRPAALGSFMMHVEAGGAAHRVRREE